MISESGQRRAPVSLCARAVVGELCACRSSWKVFGTWHILSVCRRGMRLPFFKNARKSLRPFQHNSRLDSSPALRCLLSCVRILTVTVVLVTFSLISVLCKCNSLGSTVKSNTWLVLYIHTPYFVCIYKCVCKCAWPKGPS